MNHTICIRTTHRLSRHILNGRDRPSPADLASITARCISSTPYREVKLLPAPRSHTSHVEHQERNNHFSRYPRTFSLPSTPHSASPAPPSNRRPSFSDGRPPSSILRRFFSHASTNNAWSLLNPFRTQDPDLQPRNSSRDLPPLASFLDDAQSPNRSGIPKATNEPRLRCTEFDEHGNVTLVNGEFKKSELIAKYGLLPRDLRKIDSSLLPHITVRPSAILVNLLHLRVLIRHDRVLVFDAYGSTDSYTQSVFMYDLEGKLRQAQTQSNGSLPYEFRALEAVLISVTTGLESEFEGVKEPIVRVLRELEEDIDRDKLRYLLVYSKKLGSFEQKARLVREALDELLESDEDLDDMYLSEKARGVVRKEEDENDHTDIELLLESYHKVSDEIVQVAEGLVSNIRNTEEIVKAILDANRNSLMLLELRFSIMTLGLGAGTFIAALYGMNLKNFIEESDLGFWGVSLTCSLLSVLVLTWGLRVLRRVQRVSMWGQGMGGKKASAPGVLGGFSGGSGGQRPSIKEQRRIAKAAQGSGKTAGGGGGGSSWSWGFGGPSAAAEATSPPTPATHPSYPGGFKAEKLRQMNSRSQAYLGESRTQRDQGAARRSSHQQKAPSAPGSGSSMGNTISGMGTNMNGGSKDI